MISRILECRVSAVTVRSNKGCDSVLTAFYVKNTDIPYIKNRTVILEYRMEPESSPILSFLAENEVTALCYGPDDSPVICGGLVYFNRSGFLFDDKIITDRR